MNETARSSRGDEAQPEKAESLKENSPGQAMRKQASPWVIDPKQIKPCRGPYRAWMICWTITQGGTAFALGYYLSL